MTIEDLKNFASILPNLVQLELFNSCLFDERPQEYRLRLFSLFDKLEVKKEKNMGKISYLTKLIKKVLDCLDKAGNGVELSEDSIDSTDLMMGGLDNVNNLQKLE